MTSTADSRSSLAPAMVTALLQTAARVRDRGDTARARALLRTLAAQAPDDWQVWQALAEVAETDAERLEALGRLAALAAPAAPSITRPLPEIHGPQSLPVVASPPSPAAPPRPAAAPAPLPVVPPPDPVWEAPRAVAPAEDVPPPGWFRSHWLTYASVAVIVLLLGGVLLLARERLPAAGAQPTPTPPLPGAVAAPTADPLLPTAAPLPTADPLLPTAAPLPTADPLLPTTAPLPTADPLLPTTAPLPTADPLLPTTAPTAGETLAPGQVMQDGVWSITVLRPDHLVLLDGSIGAAAPRGRFVLALLAVSNGGPGPARLPAERLALTDARGGRYTPAPGVSSAYLATFQRGVRGDLSLEEDVPAGAGIVSIPVIFDVPPDATGLTLRVGESSGGWPVGGR